MAARSMAGQSLILAVLMAGTAQAETALDVPEGSLVVTATRLVPSSFDLPISTSTVTSDEIHDGQLQVNLSESLRAVPGVVVQNRQNYAQDLQISSRGFGARSTFGVRGLRIYVDGIPATMPDGQAQTSNIDLGSAARIEVIRGPFSALYGNSAGGVIAVTTEDGAPGLATSATFEAGSYGFLRYGAKASAESGNLNYVFDASNFQTNGYRDHSSASRADFNVKLRYTIDQDSQITVVGNAVDLPNANDALGLTRAQYAADPRQAGANALAFNTRKSVDQGQGGIVYKRDVDSDDTLNALLYLGHRDTTQFQAIPVASEAPPTSPGGVISLSNTYWGTDLHWTHVAQLGEVPLQVTGGVSYDDLNDGRKGYLNFIGNVLGVQGALRRDEDDVVYDIDEYVQAQAEFGTHWLLQAGLRHSDIQVNSHDHYIAPGNGDDSGSKAYRALEPVAGLTYRVTPAVDVYVSYGKGLQTPTTDELAYRSIDGTQTGLNFALKASRSDNYETGIKANPGGGITLTAAGYHIATENEIVVEANAGGRAVYQNVAQTTRNGVELSAQGKWDNGLGAVFTYTILNATVDQPFLTCPGSPCTTPVTVAAGNRIPGVPRQMAYGEVSWRHEPLGLEVAAELHLESKVYVDDINSDAAAGFATAAVRTGLTQHSERWTFREFARLDNLANRRYAGSVIVDESNSRFFEPAPGRTVFGGISASLSW